MTVGPMHDTQDKTSGPGERCNRNSQLHAYVIVKPMVAENLGGRPYK